MFDQNINKRGTIAKSKKKQRYPVGPIVLVVLIFIVVGSGTLRDNSVNLFHPYCH